MLIGHPEHDLLFIATQVARAAGLKNPANSVAEYRRTAASGIHLSALTQDWHGESLEVPLDHTGRKYRTTTVMFPESDMYEMLARGHAPQSQPFRDWVFKEVLPSIRKTGQYNVNESTTETGQQFAGELAALSDAVSGLLKQNSTILGMLRRRQRGGCWSIFRSNTRAPT